MRKVASLIFIVLLPVLMKAQEVPLTDKPVVMISLVPQYAFQSGFRMDFDLPLNERNWIQLAPIFFAGNNVEMSITSADKLGGLALHAYHRYYPEAQRDRFKPYMAWGPVFQYYSLDFKVYNGNIKVSKHTNINRFGADLTMGFVSQGSALFFDFYAGAGIRESILSGDKDSGEQFNDTFLDFGYSGVLLVAGVRIGVMIKKSK